MARPRVSLFRSRGADRRWLACAGAEDLEAGFSFFVRPVKHCGWTANTQPGAGLTSCESFIVQ